MVKKLKVNLPNGFTHTHFVVDIQHTQKSTNIDASPTV